MVSIGDQVVYVDPLGQERAALVTQVWGVMGGGTEPGVNIVFVSDDTARTDPYGRQIERNTSLVHQSGQPAPGNYWKAA